MLQYKQKRNNGRTPFAGVYKFVCVCVCVCVVCVFIAHWTVSDEDKQEMGTGVQGEKGRRKI